ncbi:MULTISPECIES: hypothetical protein [Vibrio]|nr:MULTISPECIES: hypothetical protein [Vibrio]
MAFIERKENVMLFSPSCVGKSHLVAVSFGYILPPTIRH